MIQLLLNPTNILIALIAGAVLLPMAAWSLHRARPQALPRRPAIIAGSLGPFALLYWFFHEAVLAVVGFDSIFSVAIVVGVAMTVGWFAGGWAREKGRK